MHDLTSWSELLASNDFRICQRETCVKYSWGHKRKTESASVAGYIEIGKSKGEKAQVKTKYLRKQTILAAVYVYKSRVIFKGNYLQ